MNNLRQKINQLRVGYFMPAAVVIDSTQYLYNPRICTNETVITRYGAFKYHTPCVDYVSVIHNITYQLSRTVQSMRK